ncbi:MAG: FAD-binding oxidoreductase [Phycisphaerae bacterium]|jgi:D-arginine dehydrogenase
MQTDVDVLIVGAGLAGAATAYHLALCSELSVLVVDKESVPGAHSSGRSAAIIREQGIDPVLQTLMTDGASVLRRGELAPFDQNGLMLLGLGESDVASHVPRARGIGLWCPDDGVVEVAKLLDTYLAPTDTRFDTTVSGWTRLADRLEVDTSRGKIVTRFLVNAGGPWAGALGDIPLTPKNRTLFGTPPLDWVDPSWPCVWDVNVGLYFRPESGGLLLSACDETPAEPGDYAEDPTALDLLAEKLTATQPGLDDLRIRSTWVGQRVFAPDQRFVIGFDPRNNRIFHVAGLGGHGVTASYSVGKLAADLISRRTTPHAAPFAPARLL